MKTEIVAYARIGDRGPAFIAKMFEVLTVKSTGAEVLKPMVILAYGDTAEIATAKIQKCWDDGLERQDRLNGRAAKAVAGRKEKRAAVSGDADNGE